MAQPQIPTLQATLDERQSKSNVSSERRTIMVQANEDLRASGILNEIINIGDKAPDFTLPNVDGSSVSLSEALQAGSVVLVFYRGAWCPYCNLALRAYQQILPEIQARGAQLITVSPQTPDNSLTMAEKNELQFAVLSDEDNQVAREYKLVFTVPKDVVEIYDNIGIDLVAANGNEHYELPLPGTYVIAQDGTVHYAFADTNYVKRAEPADILAALDKLAN